MIGLCRGSLAPRFRSPVSKSAQLTRMCLLIQERGSLDNQGCRAPEISESQGRKEGRSSPFSHFTDDVAEAYKGLGAGLGLSQAGAGGRSKGPVVRAQRHGALCQEDLVPRLLR